MSHDVVTEKPYPAFTLPARVSIDESFPIRLSGLSPGQRATIWARTHDGQRNVFQSHAVFVADDEGKIDTSRNQPVEGSYDSLDPMGLFWSMKPENPKHKLFFAKTKSKPLLVRLTAGIDGRIVAETEVERYYARSGITKLQVEERDLNGTLFYPETSDPVPGVIILSGSDGGSREDAAALLASHGYAAWALPYFGAENLPKDLVKIPLEYFGRAIQWLKNQPLICNGRIGVVGLSRGGELALLLGAKYPEISAVISAAPSAYHYAGLRNFVPQPQPSWTFHNEELPFLKSKFQVSSLFRFYFNWITRRPISNVSSFYQTLKDTVQAEAASIPVERIKGPVMLISGGDDQLWPSSLYADIIMKRLERHRHPYADLHLHYPGAGHFLCFPYTLPYMPPNIVMSPFGGMMLTFGGSAEANTAASLDSWPKMLEFLGNQLK